MNVKEEGVPKYLEKRGEESRWQRIARFGKGRYWEEEKCSNVEIWEHGGNGERRV